MHRRQTDEKDADLTSQRFGGPFPSRIPMDWEMFSDIVPRATYRLQFNDQFTFSDALRIVPYLDELGISHIYASPFFRSAPGSAHGYDVCDHNQFDPEIGTAADFEALSRALAERGMSILVDFVPNHMGISGLENRWWADVLENGANSPYAKYFDIDWKPLKRELENQVLLPILGDQYGRVLERGELKVAWQEGAFFVDYFGKKLPMAPASVLPLLEEAVSIAGIASEDRQNLSREIDVVYQRPGLATSMQRRALRQWLTDLGREGEPLHRAVSVVLEKLQADFDRLDTLLSQQYYRLSFWKVATEEINYRRFFDVNTLAALRMEEPEVFADAHRLLLELVAKNAISGIRIDHIDGLALPGVYLAELQKAIAKAVGSASGDPRPGWLLVEKILGADEELPASWLVHGTTGYEFVSEVVGLQIDPAAEAILTDGYTAFTGQPQSFSELVYRGKRLVMEVSMAAEINSLGYLLNQISEGNRWYRDFTVNALTAAVREVIACFPVYRSYLEPGHSVSDADRRLVMRAIVLARRRNPGMDRTVFEFLRDVLLPPEENLHPVDDQLRGRFVLKFQQTTGPVMAKGVEDTAFYVYNRFVALNEVGSDPGKFSLSVNQFHTNNQRRAETYPYLLLASSTHDTKRSEDVRSRLTVLSEMPADWLQAATRWRELNRPRRRDIDGEWAPDANEEYLLYQILVGCWPLEKMDAEALPIFIARMQEYMVKALHEAKVNSGWIDPNEVWDSAVREFVASILEPVSSNAFPRDLESLVEKISFAGSINSLSQTVLKLTSPGVPDFYQGTEIWDWSLVDPDNRRPVLYEKRQQMLDSLDSFSEPGELLANWKDGRIKLHVIHQILALRKVCPDMFARGEYFPLQVSGEKSDCVIAFERRAGGKTLLVIVPRMTTLLGDTFEDWDWGDTHLDHSCLHGIDLFSKATADSTEVGSLLKNFPVAVYLTN